MTLRAYTYRTSVARMGGEFKFPVSAEVREWAGVAAGDEVEVRIELDTTPREVTVPADLAEALERDQDAKRVFEKLSYSNRKRHVLSVEGAKSDATRQRRIGRALDELRTAAA